MGKIKKILENELVGSTQSTDIYPVTSIKAVYDENNERLDNFINRKNDEIQKQLNDEVVRAINVESNLKETINNITEVNENATSANIVTINNIPNSSSSNVQQALNELFNADEQLNTAILAEKKRAEAAEQANAQAIAEEKVAIMSTDRIADASVTTTKIANGAVTTEKLADKAVTAAKLADGVIVQSIGNGGQSVMSQKASKRIFRELSNNASSNCFVLVDDYYVDGRTHLPTYYVGESNFRCLYANLLPNRSYTFEYTEGIASVSFYNGTIDNATLVESKPYAGGISTPSSYDFCLVSVQTYYNDYVKYHFYENKSVITNKLADGAVTAAKLADKSVTTDKLADGQCFEKRTTITLSAENTTLKNGLYTSKGFIENTTDNPRFQSILYSNISNYNSIDISNYRVGVTGGAFLDSDENVLKDFSSA